MSNQQHQADALIASALKLSVSDRVALVNAMLDSIDEDEKRLSKSEIDQAWSDEISLSMQEIESGEVKTVSSSDLWKQLGGKPNA